MKRRWVISGFLSLSVLILLISPGKVWAQAYDSSSSVTSPEVHEDKRVTFRIAAPNADSVKLSSSDIPGSMYGTDMNQNSDGVWEITTDRLTPGAYRYNFNVEGVPTIDPRNIAISEANEHTWSLVVVPGNKMMDTREVPHGSISEVTYHSESLDKFRRMHVYTPPGYEKNSDKYPVFYLLHGAFDSDDSWSTVGRTGFILDNLIAEGKAKPMIVVMPDGHTRPFTMGEDMRMDEFINDFKSNIRPHIEQHYRVFTDRGHRAMAGLSMGGAHTLNIAVPNLRDYSYIGVFSSGICELTGESGGSGGDQGVSSYEKQNQDILVNDKLKEGLNLFWFATGKDDFLIETSRATVELFEEHGFDVVYEETEGAHTWLNWRDYLIEFTPKLFTDN